MFFVISVWGEENAAFIDFIWLAQFSVLLKIKRQISTLIDWLVTRTKAAVGIKRKNDNATYSIEISVHQMWMNVKLYDTHWVDHLKMYAKISLKSVILLHFCFVFLFISLAPPARPCVIHSFVVVVVVRMIDVPLLYDFQLNGELYERYIVKSN